SSKLDNADAFSITNDELHQESLQKKISAGIGLGFDVADVVPFGKLAKGLRALGRQVNPRKILARLPKGMHLLRETGHANKVPFGVARHNTGVGGAGPSLELLKEIEIPSNRLKHLKYIKADDMYTDGTSRYIRIGNRLFLLDRQRDDLTHKIQFFIRKESDRATRYPVERVGDQWVVKKESRTYGGGQMEVVESQPNIMWNKPGNAQLTALSTQPGLENVEFVGTAVIALLAQKNIPARLGGSVAARAYGAPRFPVDLDLELRGPLDWRKAYDALINTNTDVTINGRRAHVTGYSAGEVADGEGGVVKLKFKFDNGNESEIAIDLTNENNSFFNKDLISPQNRGVQIDVGAVTLLQPEEVVLNYLSRIINNPKSALKKMDIEQISGIFKKNGVTKDNIDSRMKLANLIASRVKPEKRGDYYKLISDILDDPNAVTDRLRKNTGTPSPEPMDTNQV
uniref:hypothetical protein n=1 Tax=Burkholderia pyrrocinia TaxID=60550 RepID=UPI00158DAB6A